MPNRRGLQDPVRWKTVLFSIPASLFLLAAGGPARAPAPAPAAPPAPAGPAEPGGPIGAGASLVDLVESGGRLRAVVRVTLLSHLVDAEATVTGIPHGAGGGAEAREPLARVLLSRREARSVTVEADVEPGRDNHLFFEVKARGAGGFEEATQVYLRVPLDPSTEPEIIGEYVRYQGLATGVRP